MQRIMQNQMDLIQYLQNIIHKKACVFPIQWHCLHQVNYIIKGSDFEETTQVLSKDYSTKISKDCINLDENVKIFLRF